jgi:RNA polymerase sigma-70 factor (ECF subfamily)
VTDKEQDLIFHDWLEQHKALIFKVVRAYAQDVMEQDDLFQEITIQVWHSIPSFRHESSSTTWIYRISLNTAIKWVRKERRYKVETLDDLQPVLHERERSEDERLGWLYEEIHKLDEIDRSITLLLLDDFTYKEIAAMLGITESHVGVKINRIKKHLIKQKTNGHGI